MGPLQCISDVAHIGIKPTKSLELNFHQTISVISNHYFYPSMTVQDRGGKEKGVIVLFKGKEFWF